MQHRKLEEFLLYTVVAVPQFPINHQTVEQKEEQNKRRKKANNQPHTKNRPLSFRAE